MPTLLHLADLHLGWLPPCMPHERARKRQERRDDVLRRAVDLAVDEQVDLVAIAGDLFDRHDPDPAVRDACRAQLQRLVDAGIDLVTLPGTHDEITYPTSVYRTVAAAWPGILVRSHEVTRVATLPRPCGTIHVYGAAFLGGGPTRLESFPRAGAPAGDIHVGIFHGRIDGQDGHPPPRGHVLDAVALEQSGYQYVALGGLHRREARQLGPTTCAWPGLVESLGFDEPGAACITRVHLEGDAVEISALPFPAQPLLTHVMDASGMDAAEIVSRIRRMENPEAMLRVRLEGSPASPLDLPSLTASLADAFFHLELVSACETLDEGALDVWSSELTILGQFVRRMQERQARAGSDRERAVLERALRLGVEALRAEVAR